MQSLPYPGCRPCRVRYLSTLRRTDWQGLTLANHRQVQADSLAAPCTQRKRRFSIPLPPSTTARRQGHPAHGLPQAGAGLGWSPAPRPRRGKGAAWAKKGMEEHVLATKGAVSPSPFVFSVTCTQQSTLQGVIQCHYQKEAIRVSLQLLLSISSSTPTTLLTEEETKARPQGGEPGW